LKSQEVEGRWRNGYMELEREVEKLKKEQSDFYSTDRFDANYM
jgi:hypothetical protein